MAVTDADLLKEFAAHQSQSAFEELVRRYGKMVRSVAFRLMGNGPDADDVVQDVFLTLARKAKHFPWRTSIAGWLHHATQCAALQQLRSSRRRRRHEAQASKEFEQAVHDSTLDDRETTRMIDRELSQMPDKYRSAIVLHHFQQLQYDQAAKRLGVKEGTFAVRLKRARHLLRDRLVRRGVAVPSGALLAWLQEISTQSASAAPVAPLPWNSVLGASHTMQTTSWRLALALTLLVSILGSGSFFYLYQLSADQPAPTRKSPATNNKKAAIKVVPRTSTPVTVNGLKAWIYIGHTTFDIRRPITLTLFLENVSQHDITLDDPWWYGQHAMVKLKSVQSNTVYQWHYHNHKVKRSPEPKTLAPGERHVLNFPMPNAKPEVSKIKSDQGEKNVNAEPTPGQYLASVHFGGSTLGKDKPNKNSWQGELDTKPVSVTLVDKENPKATAGSPLASKPFKRDGLEFWFWLDASTVYHGAMPLLTFHVKNNGNKAVRLYDLSPLYRGFHVMAQAKDGGDRWEVSFHNLRVKRIIANTTIEPGQVVSMDFAQGALQPSIEWAGVGEKQQRPRALPVGEYQLTVSYYYPPKGGTAPDPSFWEGFVTVGPVPMNVVALD